MSVSLTLPRWYDLHVHMRQDAMLKPMLAAHYAMGCRGVLAMPNTKPPVAKVTKQDPLDCWSIEEYHAQMLEAGGDALEDIIIPLYLTKDTTPAMIEAGVKSGYLRAAKYYPPHGTTGADFAHTFSAYLENGVFQALADNNVNLCIHGEEHGLDAEVYFDQDSNAEALFYTNQMPELIDKVPTLRVVCEHLTTATAVKFVYNAPDNVAGTITPQHLLYTVGHLLKGCNYHLYCLPLVKYDKDREALRAAAADTNTKKFFAGTDSAPHTVKATPCGCAAGCFTGYIAPQLYAEAFELAGYDLSIAENQTAFERFLCLNGPEFYGLPTTNDTFTIRRQPQTVKMVSVPGALPGEDVVTPLPLGLGKSEIPWSIDPVAA
ncbi:MAG: dihydroorotase [Alphaproteobacteria bacterium]|nr:dihydroorotase [Alphaproteobacteria bacterium SS10]